MNASERFKTELEKGKRLFLEVGDNLAASKVFQNILDSQDAPAEIKKEASEFLSRIKIDPAAWLLLAFAIVGILIEILLIPTR